MPDANRPDTRSGKMEASVGGVRAVDRALALLLAFAGKPLQSLGELARATNLDPGTTRRMMLTLMRNGFVVQDPASQRYGLGDAVRRLSANVVDGFGLQAAVREVLPALAAELRVTSFLSVYRDNSAVCLDRYHDMQGMQLHWWPVGGAMPLNCGAAPKLLLAYQTEPAVERALLAPLVALTPKSIVVPDALRRRLVQVRRRGWEWAVDDVALGLTAAAVPVLAADGALVCALSITGLTGQLTGTRRGYYLDRLQDAAAHVQASLLRGVQLK